MKVGSKYFSSMIIVPGEDVTKLYDWSYLGRKYTNVISYPTKDPFHYNDEAVDTLSHFNTGFKVVTIHDYGHPFQKLVEFIRV